MQLVVTNFPGFCDQLKLDGGIISFLKRAQIFVGDVNAALKLGLGGMDQPTTFAEYCVPQRSSKIEDNAAVSRPDVESTTYTYINTIIKQASDTHPRSELERPPFNLYCYSAVGSFS